MEEVLPKHKTQIGKVFFLFSFKTSWKMFSCEMKEMKNGFLSSYLGKLKMFVFHSFVSTFLSLFFFKLVPS